MTDVIITGVGGQGVLLASKILMDLALRCGYDVKGSEIHGMAQRGGSVDCHVRFGECVHSPLIAHGTAQFLVALELLEGVRKLKYLAPDGVLISDLRQIDPAPVQMGTMTYPDDLVDWIVASGPAHYLVTTDQALRRLGQRRALNVLMMGVLSNYLEFPVTAWQTSIASQVKEEYRATNEQAFHLGRKLKAVQATEK